MEVVVPVSMRSLLNRNFFITVWSSMSSNGNLLLKNVFLVVQTGGFLFPGGQFCLESSVSCLQATRQSHVRT